MNARNSRNTNSKSDYKAPNSGYMCFPVGFIYYDIDIFEWIKTAVCINVFPGQETRILLERFVSLSYD